MPSKTIPVLIIISVLVYGMGKKLYEANEAEIRVEAPHEAAIQAERKKAFSRDCPKYFDANILQKYTSLRKFSWCDDIRNN